jgi:hypothetical protein
VLVAIVVSVVLAKEIVVPVVQEPSNAVVPVVLAKAVDLVLLAKF